MGTLVFFCFLMPMSSSGWKEEMRKKKKKGGFTIQLDAENRQGGLRQTAADDQQMIVSYTMEEGDKGLRNAECRASLDTMEQEKEHK